ncbi:hypothetical protein HBB06_16045 [Streptomyces sp. SNU607]|uniref:hypothetical protein n=1 Tax=Streptomyces sp. SNU607 TaxID=2718875 RepID=UPI0026E10B1B|nr:hypothetical protein [Streptomyces sp. SNU607]WKV79540.1 hypothetical protein HBB06_16045 [Streptomyces sp. SNU607]
MEEWTVENFRSLIATDLPSIQRVAAMLDLFAAEPERGYSTTALVERINLDRGQIRGTLAAFTRHLHAHYGPGNWPMRFEWATDPDSTYAAEAFTVSTRRTPLAGRKHAPQRSARDGVGPGSGRPTPPRRPL